MQKIEEKIEEMLGDALAKDVAAIAGLQGVSSADVVREAVEARVRVLRDVMAHY